MEPMTQPAATLPPPRVRGAGLLVRAALALILGTLITDGLWPGWLEDDAPQPLPDALAGAIVYGLLLLLLARPAWRSGGPPALFGAPPDAPALRWALAAGVALAALALAGLYLLFVPLSWVAPGFVQGWLLDVPAFEIHTRGEHALLANVVNVLVLVALAPLVEELLFRGLLLPAWTARWGARRAVVLSSLAFALPHADLVGAFAFGVVVALASLRTRSLWLPLVVHASHNGLVWLVVLADLLILGERPATLADLRGLWWLALVALAVGAPLLVRVLRRLPAPR